MNEALDAYLMQSAIHNAALFPSKDAPAITGVGLEDLVCSYQLVMKISERLSRRFPEQVIKQFIYLSPLKQEQLQDKMAVSSWLKDLSFGLQRLNKGTEQQYEFDVTHDQEQQLFLPKVTVTSHGHKKSYLFK